MTMYSEMLEEMVVRILSRLPPNSLVRFRCVCKLWYNLINDPSFVAKNLSFAMHNKFASHTCILVRRTLLQDRTITDEKEIAAVLSNLDGDTIDLVLSLLRVCNNDSDGHNLNFVVEDLDIPFPSRVHPSTLQIAGHCDAIICLSNNMVDNVVLCNPAIREFVVIPKSFVLSDLPPRAEHQDDYDAPWSSTVAMGVGLDSKAKEYKIVRVVETVSGGNTEHPTRAEIYTLGTNSWREIDNAVDIGCHVFWTPSFVMHFKGICYWWAFAPIDKELILTFDMSTEQFHQIPVPHCFDDSDGRYRSLAVLKESVVLLTYEVDEGPKSFDIWMMDDSTGVKGSWTKYLAFGPVEGIEIPLVFWKSDELLMVTNDSRVVSCNLGTQKLHYFPVHGLEGALYMQAVNYVKSIISVKNHNLRVSDGTDNS